MSGLAYAIHRAVQQVVPAKIFAVEHMVITAKRIATSPRSGAEPPRPRVNGSCYWITRPEDSHALIRAGYARSNLADRFQDGAFTAVLEIEGEAAAGSWYSPGSHSDDYWIDYRTQDRDVWVWDVWVSPEQRGGGLAGTLFEFAENGLSEQGYRRVLNSISSLNRSSVRAFSKAGYRTIMHIGFVRLVGWTVVKVGGRWASRRYGRGRHLDIDVPSQDT